MLSAASLLGLMLAAEATAAPAAASYALTYRAVPGCPDEAALRADVAAHVHDAARASGVRIAIQIDAAARGFAGAIVTVDRYGNEDRRQLDAADCGELGHALAFMAGVAIDLAARERPAAPAAVSEPAEPEPDAAPPVRARPLAIAPSAMGALRGGLANAPRPAAEIGLTIEDRRDHGRWLAPAGRLAVIAGGGEMQGARGAAELWLLAGRLDVCPVRATLSVFEVRPCAGLELGRVRAQATSLVDAPALTRLWAAAAASLGVRLPLGRLLFAAIDARVLFPLERDRYFFGFQPGEAFYEVPWLTGSVALGLGARF